MKRNHISKSVVGLAFILGSLSMSACSSEGDKTAGHESTAAAESTSEAGNPQFSDEKVKEVYVHYIHVKNALVNSDAKEAQQGAAALQTALTDAGSSQGADIAGKIASEAKIDVQRTEFSLLTAEVEKTVKASKLSSGKIFKQYCPMAHGGDGAYWLASESDIKNPYYGDEMLECGEVKEEIK
ncbi:DUF3347 domain-containing protein [Desertivirga xinjiangensis]|uniref:DUF3347 domain-containing protein n=1 Tax=Desertivirga xinjiangensis TaxID=539206 RepID=UPI00210D47D6|nr:DUF3347 domain-containing protein [Pedobacter xinjiangensis]